MVVRRFGTNEMVSQKLTKPMLNGQCYSFSIYLAKSNEFRSGSSISREIENFSNAVILRIWGGDSFCNQKELLAESPLIDNTEWKKFEFKFKPQSDLDYLELEAYYFFTETQTEPYNGNLLLDNCSDIKIYNK